MLKIHGGRLVAATMIAAATLSAVGVTSPAQASPADCEGGVRGFIDIPDNLTGTVRATRDLGHGVRVELHSGVVAGATRGWAKIVGETRSGDRVWMDWTTSSGESWLQCGPFVVSGTRATKTSAAQRTNSSTAWRFRACGDLPRVDVGAKCTGWW